MGIASATEIVSFRASSRCPIQFVPPTLSQNTSGSCVARYQSSETFESLCRVSGGSTDSHQPNGLCTLLESVHHARRDVPHARREIFDKKRPVG